MNLRNYALPLAVIGGLASGPALAETYVPVSIEALKKNPGKYVKKKVEVKGIPRGISSMAREGAVRVHFYISSSLYTGTVNKGILIELPRDFHSRYANSIAALVDAEIRDGDQEEIMIRGKFQENGVLTLESLTTAGYTINDDGVELSK